MTVEVQARALEQALQSFWDRNKREIVAAIAAQGMIFGQSKDVLNCNPNRVPASEIGIRGRQFADSTIAAAKESKP